MCLLFEGQSPTHHSAAHSHVLNIFNETNLFKIYQIECLSVNQIRISLAQGEIIT